mgnify:CR=1 FL=1
MLGAEEFVRMIHAFGAERVLFGTDSPWASQKETLREIEALPLTASEKDLILYTNSEHLLR